MEKNNTTTSNFSICQKIRQTLATNPTFRAIHRMKQHYQKPYNPQHVKVVNTKEEGGGIIPIVFDYSTPNGNSSNSMVSKVASPNVGISERKGQVVTKSEPKVIGLSSTNNGKHKEETRIPLKEHHGGVGLEHQGKKTLDINDTFSEYIQRAKNRIRTVSNVGKGQNNHVPVPDEYNGNNKMGNQHDPFSDFIQQARKRIRTTSNVGKTNSLKRG